MSTITKKALANSLKNLMEKTSLEKITVKDVVNNCGVNRQTFYYHFQDIYDLLSWIYKTDALESISEFKTYETWQQGFLLIFKYISNNKDFCMNTFHSLGREQLEDYLYKVTFDLLIGVVNEVSQGTTVSEKEKSFIAEFYSYAFIGILTSWMKKGLKENPEVIIDEINILIEGDIKKAIDKYI